MLTIPLQPLPSQVVRTIVGNQSTTLTIRQLADALYMTIELDGKVILENVICENANRIIRDAYFGFVGDFMFIDNSGDNGLPSEDPYFTGLGSQFTLLYLEVADLT